MALGIFDTGLGEILSVIGSATVPVVPLEPVQVQRVKIDCPH